jgi:gliding motility-associated-like protein
MKFILTVLITLVAWLASAQKLTFETPSATSPLADSCDLHLGPNVSVCLGVNVPLNPNPLPGNYEWTGSGGLSCTDCPSPVLTNPVTGFYIFIATLTRPECVSKDTITVLVLGGQQTKYNIANDTAICLGQSVQIGGASLPATFYSWASNPPEFASSVANPSVAPTQTTTYILTAASGSCPVPARDSVKVTVVVPPVLAARADTSVCAGQPVLLGNTVAQPGVTYTWSPAAGLSDPAAANPTATPQQTTLYTLTATNGACTVVDQVLIAVPSVALTLSVTDTVLICKGSPVTVTAVVSPGNAPVSWSPIVGLQIAPNGLSVSASPDESTRYTATATVPGCALSKSFWVQVDSLPSDLSILPSDTTICQGQLVTLKSKTYEPFEHPGITFLWSGMSQLTPDTLYNLVVQPTDTTIYRRISTIGACVDTSEATVNVIPQAEMTITPALSTICPGESVPLSLTFTPGVVNIEWQPASILTCSDCNNPIATPSGTTTISVKGEFEGCPTQTSAQIVVKPLPQFQFPADVQLCIGQSVLLNSVTTPGATYTWTSTHPNFGTQTDPQPLWTPTQTATYFLKAEKDGCSINAQVTVTLESATLQVSGDTTVCSKFPALLTANGSLLGTYTWSSGQMAQAIIVNPEQTTTYTVTYAYGTDCTLTDMVTVNVQGVGADIAFPLDRELCPGDSVLLNSANTPGATYAWTSIPVGFVSSNPQPVVAPNVNTTYTLKATNGNCVSTQTVTIIAHRATLRVSNDTTVCAGEPLTLSALGSVTGTYEWSPGAVESPTLPLNPATAGNYSVLYTYGDDCTLSDVVVVKVVPGISVDIIAEPDTNQINLGQTIDLTAIVSPTQSLSNFKFSWFEGPTALVGSTDMITAKPSTTDTTAIAYTVIVTAPNGCTAQDILKIKVLQPKVAFPNAFTPNGDTQNNEFRMVVLEGLALVELMQIYDRWGKLVFSSTDPQAAWDGMVDGKAAPADVYAYAIRWRDGLGALGIMSGDVTLLR